MRRRSTAFGLLLLAGAAVGCTINTPRYTISADTVSTLRTYRGRSVAVGNFTAAEPGKTSIQCRGMGPISPPDGESFEAFVRKALVDELTIAELYVPSAPVVLTGRLDAIDFSSGSGFGDSASWTIGLTLGSSTGQTASAVNVYRFSSSFMGDAACHQVAQALTPAVQELIKVLVKDPGFPGLIGAR